MANNDWLDDVMLQQIIEEKWPNDKLPTPEELLQFLRDGEKDNPLLSTYLKNRPGLYALLKECV